MNLMSSVILLPTTGLCTWSSSAYSAPPFPHHLADFHSFFRAQLEKSLSQRISCWLGFISHYVISTIFSSETHGSLEFIVICVIICFIFIIIFKLQVSWEEEPWLVLFTTVSPVVTTVSGTWVMVNKYLWPKWPWSQSLNSILQILA